MEKLWAPWRMEYIENGCKMEGCLFCVLSARDNDKESLILHRGETAFVMLNSFPYNSGHLMVASYKHTADLYEFEDEELLEAGLLVRYSMRLLKACMQPDGFNVGMNLGKSAGAGVIDHAHWHIVPRWDGDTNFMPVTAGAKVLPQSLEATYDKLKRCMQELGGP